ncbi:MAG: rhamnogalacturonan acetylesterase [Opitutaceae bacterium]|nr:rhamnogalacturonan acetylesterase [Opitutaceae bacterium]
MHTPHRIAAFLVAASFAASVAASAGSSSWTFDFADPRTRVAFTAEHGYGFDPDSAGARFSVLVPEGNYRVTLTFGHDTQAGDTTVKAESRRLMLESVRTAPGETVTRTFVVNVRNDRVPPPEKNAPGGDRVLLNDREVGALHWDDKLTLEFVGPHPAARTVAIERVEVPTVFLLGDSTVTDQRREPSASWGQMLTRFFKPDIAVANHAESGETIKSFITGLRLAKVLSEVKTGDWILIQFGHNDSKKQWPQTWVEAHTTYPAYLRALIAEARLRGATPVLVTSMQRRNFDAAGKITNSHGDYPAAVRAVAVEEKVALIDLEAMSRAFYEALGPERSPLAFADGGRDKTHHNNYGAYELARCVVQGIRDAHLDLAAFIVDDLRDFDPAHPDAPESLAIAASPGPAATERPRGN